MPGDWHLVEVLPRRWRLCGPARKLTRQGGEGGPIRNTFQIYTHWTSLPSQGGVKSTLEKEMCIWMEAGGGQWARTPTPQSHKCHQPATASRPSYLSSISPHLYSFWWVIKDKRRKHVNRVKAGNKAISLGDVDETASKTISLFWHT